MDSGFEMHCPLCGHILTEINNTNKDDESVWFKCTNCNSFGDDYPLILHAALGDLQSSPGDSWSLSWVK
jgi:hypothetical protein